jgi:hypothetical protein
LAALLDLPPGSVDVRRQHGRAAHRAVVWATVWKGGEPVEVVWQNEQPFDARLTT